MEKREKQDYLVSQVLASQDFQDKRVRLVSQDSKDQLEIRVRKAKRACLASQDCQDPKETKEALGIKVSQVDQGTRVPLDFLGL